MYNKYKKIGGWFFQTDLNNCLFLESIRFFFFFGYYKMFLLILIFRAGLGWGGPGWPNLDNCCL